MFLIICNNWKLLIEKYTLRIRHRLFNHRHTCQLQSKQPFVQNQLLKSYFQKCIMKLPMLAGWQQFVWQIQCALNRILTIWPFSQAFQTNLFQWIPLCFSFGISDSNPSCNNIFLACKNQAVSSVPTQLPVCFEKMSKCGHGRDVLESLCVIYQKFGEPLTMAANCRGAWRAHWQKSSNLDLICFAWRKSFQKRVCVKQQLLFVWGHSL